MNDTAMMSIEIRKANEGLSALTPSIANTVEKAKALSIVTSEETFLQADAYLSRIKAEQVALETERKKHTGPLDEMKKDIMAEYNPQKRLLENAEMILKGATRKWWLSEQDRKRREEQKRIADDRKRQEEENLNKAVEEEKHGNATQAEHTLNQPIIDVKPKVETSFDKAKSYGKKVWKCEIVDPDEFLKGIMANKIPLDFIEIKHAAMNRKATALQGSVRWPGVEIREDVEMGVRR